MTSLLTPQTAALWAKSDRGNETNRWLPCWCHLLDVAACAYEILQRETARTLDLFAQDFGMKQRGDAAALVAALAGVHDIGKVSPAFQQKNDTCRQRVFEAGLDWGARKPTPPPKDTPHSVTSYLCLTWIFEQDYHWSPRCAETVAQAVAMHHGWPIIDPERKTNDLGREPLWSDLRKHLFNLTFEAIGSELPPGIQEFGPAAFQRLAGLTSFADWVGSSLDFGNAQLSPPQYWVDARNRASQRLDALGWRKRQNFVGHWRSLGQTFSYLSQDFSPRPLQYATEQIVKDCSEPTLLIIEAPMGEGKSEAGLYAAIELQRQIGHRGLYVALPTKATGNAMFSRTLDFLRSLKRATPIDVHLLHGSTLLNENYQELLTAKPNTNEPDDLDDSVSAEHYFSSRKRALLSEAGVGTIDQALITITPVKHQFVRLWGLGNRVVLIDEVHAYDTYTGTLLERLIEWLRELGSSVILMSATLPRDKRDSLLKAWRVDSLPEEGTYPRLTRACGLDIQQQSFAARPLAQVELLSGPSDVQAVAEELLREVSDGGCAACIVNTVDRAQKLYSILSQSTSDVHLFHARYPLEQRQQIENKVLALFGKDSGSRPKRAILVATQVVEQSLDLDFDVLYTDLAPVDLILQRSGRLHRHESNRGRRGKHEQARLHLLGLTRDNVLPDLATHHWEYVYDRYVLLRSWLCLRDKQRIDLNHDLDRLVQECYGPEPNTLPAEFANCFQVARENLDKCVLNETNIADFNIIGRPIDSSWRNFGSRCSDGEDGSQSRTRTVRTRLGPDSIAVVPLYCVGENKFLDPELTCSVSTDKTLKPTLARKVFLRSLTTSRPTVVHCLKSETVWQQTPLLRGIVPLYLDAHGTRILGQVDIKLDRELGLVYRKAGSLEEGGK